MLNNNLSINMNIHLYPYNLTYTITNEELIGKGRTSLLNKFDYKNKFYVIKYYKSNYDDKNFKEFTYLNNIYTNNKEYKCYGYNHKLFKKDDIIYKSISIYDYIEGQNLMNYLLTTRNIDILLLYTKLLKKIQELHKHYILHNDLILSNILITSNKEIKIIDYGESICYYKNKYISNYYINKEIKQELIKHNMKYITYNNNKINYTDENIITHITLPLQNYIKHINSIDIYNIYITIIRNEYYLKSQINQKNKLKRCQKLFIKIFTSLDKQQKYLSKDLFKYFMNNISMKRLNIPLYTYILYKYHKISQKTIIQLYNIYNCIIHKIDIIKYITLLIELNKSLNIKKLYILKHNHIIEIQNEIYKYIEIPNSQKLLYKLTDINIILLCIIHYSLYLKQYKEIDNLLLHFTYPLEYYKTLNIDYINNLSSIKLLSSTNKNLDIILLKNLLLI